MGGQLMFMVAIVPLASVKLNPADLAFWLSALLLIALSSPADFGVYNTMVRGLPIVKTGKAFPKYLSPADDPNFDVQNDINIDYRTRVLALVIFALRQLIWSVSVVLIISVIIAYFIYKGRSDGTIDISFILTLFFYLLVVPLYTLARFLESILIGWGLISIAKQNEAITVIFRVCAITGLMFNAMPIYSFALVHLLTTWGQFALNFRNVKTKILYDFEFSSIVNYLRHFSNEERSSFTKGQYRFGINIFSSYLIMNAGPLAVTNLKSDQSVSFYLIMVRMFQAIRQFAQVPVTVVVQKLVVLRAEGRISELLTLFTNRSLVAMILYVFGFGLSFIYIGYVFGHNLADYTYYLFMFGLVTFLELNHSNHAQLVLSKNVQPFLIPSFASGILSIVLMYPIFNKYGIVGAILVQGVVQLVFSNWYSVYLNIKEFGDTKLALYCFKDKY